MTMELPEHLRTGPLAEQAAKALMDAQAMSAASNSVPRISLLGREFRLMESGEQVGRFRDYLDVIILGVEPGPGLMIKTFYKNGYTSGAKEPPTCSSEDGISPSNWVTEKQSQTCKSCPKNIFGSAISPSGKQTKACRDSKRIWVKLADSNFEVPPPGQQPKPAAEGLKPFADRTLFGMNVTVASLKSFAEHGRALSALGQGPAVCVTRMTMLDKEFPELQFAIQSWLDADTAPQSLKLANDRPWKIQYANAALALAGGEPAKQGLPSALPGVPDHLKQQAQPEPQGTQTVVDAATPAAAKPVGNLNDSIDHW